MNLETGHDYFYVKDDVKRRFKYIKKTWHDPSFRTLLTAPVDLIKWHDKEQQDLACIGLWLRGGAKIKPVVNAGVELHRRTHG